MTIRENDLKELFRLQKKVETVKETLGKLWDRAGVKSPSLNGMLHGTGPYDRTGELVPEIVDLENELQQLEQKYWQLRLNVSSWIDAQEDQKAAVILSMRYLDGFDWKRIEKEFNDIGADPITEDAARKYVARYLKNTFKNNEENNGQK